MKDIFLGNLSLNEGKNFVGLPVLNSRIHVRVIFQCRSLEMGIGAPLRVGDVTLFSRLACQGQKVLLLISPPRYACFSGWGED